MMIEVELFGGLAPHQPRKQQLESAGPVTAGEIAARLGLEPTLTDLIFINGVQSAAEDRVPPGARVCFFPYLSGG